MRITITQPERLLLERVLRFANTAIKSTKQVESLFTDLPFVGVFDPEKKRRFQVLPASEIETYRRDQRKVRDALGKIVSRNRDKQKSVATEAQEIIQRMPVILVPSAEGRPQVIYLFSGVEACCWYV